MTAAIDLAQQTILTLVEKEQSLGGIFARRQHGFQAMKPLQTRLDDRTIRKHPKIKTFLMPKSRMFRGMWEFHTHIEGLKRTLTMA